MDQGITLQQTFWNRWNAATREKAVSDISRDQQDVVVRWLNDTGKTDLNIIEVGCGSGWLCPSLKQFGRVTATDLSDQVLARARDRVPDVDFIAGDFMALNLGSSTYDVVVTIEMLSHVADQTAFIARLAKILRPGGLLILATQNRPVLEKHNNIPPPQPGQLRQWVDRSQLRTLLSPHFEVGQILSITPNANKGPMRLVAGHKAKRILRMLCGKLLERMLATMGFGWTLMALARKPAQSGAEGVAAGEDLDRARS